MDPQFKLLMIGAMYENGGNTTHRFLDGHPQMHVYPFESQIGTRLVMDSMSSMFPVKYRWPVFALHSTSRQDYFQIIDEEVKVRARTSHVSKFRHVPFDFSDDERCAFFETHVARTGRSRANNVAAFFKATFDAWKDCRKTGRESVYVGYSPVIGIDADKILTELPEAHVLHIVRNPWSAYADTKKRPVPLSLPDYILGWVINQHHALIFKEKFPGRMHVVRFEDLVENPKKVLGAVCQKLGLEAADSLSQPSWNGAPLEEVYPWGTIRRASPEANRATAKELSAEEIAEIRARAKQYVEALDYKSFL
jgi:hypothetical protein